jgi:DNA-binding transcriptional LysR family regulator
MTLTQFGEILRPYAQTAMLSLDQAARQIEVLRKGTTASITIAAAPLLASQLFPPAVIAFKKKRSAAQVRIVAQSRGLIEGLLAGDYDVAVTVLEDSIAAKGLTQHFLFNDRLVLTCRADHPLLKKKRVTPQDLMQCKWVHSESQTWHHRRLERYFEEAGLTIPPATIQSRAPTILKGIISCSDHVAVMTRLGVEPEVAAGTLGVIELRSPLMSRPIGVIWRNDNILSSDLQSFITALERTKPRL